MADRIARISAGQCVMELFVFVRMGGQRSDIVVKLLEDGSADLPARLCKFDAGKAKCFLDRDRQRLLAVIESSFGTFEPFNKIVRGIFARQLFESKQLGHGFAVHDDRVEPPARQAWSL